MSTSTVVDDLVDTHKFIELKSKLEALDPSLAECLEAYVFQDIIAGSRLEFLELELCIVASLVAQNNQDQLLLHFDIAYENGISPEKLLAVIIHCIPFCGWPVGLEAIGLFKRWLHASEIPFTPASKEDIYGSVDVNFAELGKTYGAKIYKNYPALESSVKNMAPGLENYVTAGIFGRFYGRRDLDLRLRQLTAIAILTSLQRLPQLESHMKGAFMVGIDGDEVREILRVMHLYAGWPSTLNALGVLTTIENNQ